MPTIYGMGYMESHLAREVVDRLRFPQRRENLTSFLEKEIFFQDSHRNAKAGLKSLLKHHLRRLRGCPDSPYFF